MAAPSAQEPPGRDEMAGWRPDPVSAEEREAWLDHLVAQDEPFGPEEWLDPGDELTAGELAEIAGATGPGWRGRRGPGQPGSARVFAGESCSRAAAFGTGMALDVMPGGPELALCADAAAGPPRCWMRPRRGRPRRRCWAGRPGEIPGIGPIDPALAPRPGERGRPEPEDDLVRDSDRRAGTRHRPQMRQTRTQEPPQRTGETPQTRPVGRTRSAPRDQ